MAGYLPEVNILNRCTLTLASGELVGVIGPNGAGKSTLLKAMFGLLQVRSGTVYLHGDTITNLSAHALVAMGRALMMDPSVLLLDEPSAGLSPRIQDEVFDRIRQVNEAGVSIVMVEQNARRCLQIADRGYVLDQGQNAYTGTGRELLDDPKVIECYLGTLARVE